MREELFDLAVRAALSQLPHTQARALWLVDVCGASYAQVAAETSVDRRSVIREVRGARHAIRDHVGHAVVCELRARRRGHCGAQHRSYQ